ncbi:protein of unknown function DUF2479 [Bacillus phage Carmen17]|uniref:BppU N-terminal domain-containing protein n=1 Tax=Bacillus phage Carmen17 TaxID=2072797 RepID=A0A2I7QIR0_9CAUD|nr:minor tail protein [Bacillus phage Carmen17]AUR81258.1 protein of unknown function DUF2479 [Bacillus phage Carmen17]
MANNIFKRREITLDTFNDLNKEMIASFSQGDRISDKLIIRLTNDKDGPLDLTDAVQVRIDFRKPDGKLVFQYCNIEDRPNALISAVLTTQTLAAPGKVYAEVTVKYPEGKDAVTRQFTFWVQDAIASDKSIESQNEWPMLERAIVAGDMLAGVDLVAIIQAGELAKGALPKAGGTMTGTLSVNSPVFINSKDGTKKYSLETDANGKAWFTDKTNNRDIFTVETDGTFNVVTSKANVVKKAGDTMTGPLKLDRVTSSSTSYINYVTGATSNFFAGLSAIGKYHIYDDVNKVTPFEYDPATQSFNVNTNTNLAKKAGDTFTGPVTFDAPFTIRGSAASWEMRPYAAGVYSKGFRHTINTTNNFYAIAPMDAAGAANWSNQAALYGDTGKFEVASLATRLDGTTNITVSSEATAPDVNYPLQAVRRNSTVMLKGAVMLNANATGVLVATLPPELRPTTGNLSMYTPTTDGTAMVQVFVNGTTGAVAVSSNGKGKRVDIVLTYVI